MGKVRFALALPPLSLPVPVVSLIYERGFLYLRLNFHRNVIFITDSRLNDILENPIYTTLA